LKVWRLGGVGVGAREVDAAFYARDRDLGRAPFQLDAGGPGGGKDLRQ
jgi:hypothetical protein